MPRTPMRRRVMQHQECEFTAVLLLPRGPEDKPGLFYCFCS